MNPIENLVKKQLDKRFGSLFAAGVPLGILAKKYVDDAARKATRMGVLGGGALGLGGGLLGSYLMRPKQDDRISTKEMIKMLNAMDKLKSNIPAGV